MKRLLAGIFLIGALLPLRAQITETKLPRYILNEPSGALDFKEQPFDVLNYTVDLDLTKAPSKAMQGKCAISVLWTEDPAGKKFHFHLRSLSVDSVLFKSIPVTASPVGTPASADFHFEIPAPAGVAAGDTTEFTVYYSGTMTAEYPTNSWGGVQSDNGTLYALGVGFSNEYVSASRHWMPCYDHPSDKATFDISMRIKKEKMAVSIGKITTQIPDTDSTKIVSWKSKLQCATYLLTFAVDNFVPVHFIGIGSAMAHLKAVVYTLPQDTTIVKKSFKHILRMIGALELKFGAYPFEKVGYVLTPKGAMEHQTMISYPTSLARSGEELNYVAAHELAHQWWGDLVTPLDFRHAWLTESFATFSESVWAEDIGGGYYGFLKNQSDKVNRYIKTISNNEGVFPLVDFPRAAPSSNYPETIYQKGAVVLGMLRYELGDSLFFGSLKSYLQKYAFKNTTTDSLLKTLNEYTGRDLTWFFNQWVYGKGWPQIAVEASRQPEGFKRVRVVLKQRQSGEYGVYTNLPVEIGFKNPSGEIFNRVVKMTEKEQVFELDSVPDFTTVVFNQGLEVRSLVELFSLTDVEESPLLKSEDHFEIQPNPATESATVIFSAKGTSTLEVFTVTGQKVFSEKFAPMEGMKRFLLKTGDFPAGIYIVKISDDSNSVSEQLSIVR